MILRTGPFAAAFDFPFLELEPALLDFGLVGFGLVGLAFFLLTNFSSLPIHGNLHAMKRLNVRPKVL